MRYFAFCCALLLVGLPIFADETAAAARALVERQESAVVTVRLVARATFSFPGLPGEQEEAVQEHTGSVIDPTGLTVVSLTATDPSSFYQDVMESMGGEDAAGFQYRVEIKDVKIITADGTEIPARVVLRDKDLDLTFLRPVDPLPTPMPALDLKISAAPERFDPLLVVYRMGKVAGRACAITVQRVQFISKKPRETYFLSDDASDTAYGGFSRVLGSPAFTLDGSLAGFVLFRSLKAAAGVDEPESTLVIVPAAQVAEVAQQAPTIEQAEKTEQTQEKTSESSSSSGSTEIVLRPDGNAQEL